MMLFGAGILTGVFVGFLGVSIWVARIQKW